MNDPLVANLYDLWEAGYSFLPRMAKIYEEMYYSTPGHYCDDAFSHPIRDEQSDAQGPWGDLRTLLQDTIFKESCANLYDTGDALVKVVESYTETDQLNAGQISELKDRIGDGKQDMKDGDVPGPPADRKPPSERDHGTDAYDPLGKGNEKDKK